MRILEPTQANNVITIDPALMTNKQIQHMYFNAISKHAILKAMQSPQIMQDSAARRLAYWRELYIARCLPDEEGA